MCYSGYVTVRKGFEGGSGSGEGADVISFPKGNEFLMRQDLPRILAGKGIVDNRGETHSSGPMLIVISQRGFTEEEENNKKIIEEIKSAGENCTIKVCDDGQLPFLINKQKLDTQSEIGKVLDSDSSDSESNDLVVVVCNDSGEHLVQQAVRQGYCGVIIFTNKIGIEEEMKENSQKLIKSKRGDIIERIKNLISSF